MKSMSNLESEQKTSSETMIPMDDLGINTVFRCDACGVQAFTAAMKDAMLLLLCGHHTNRHRDALESDGWNVDDKTHLINEKPSVSATA